MVHLSVLNGRAKTARLIHQYGRDAFLDSGAPNYFLVARSARSVLRRRSGRFLLQRVLGMPGVPAPVHGAHVRNQRGGVFDLGLQRGNERVFGAHDDMARLAIEFEPDDEFHALHPPAAGFRFDSGMPASPYSGYRIRISRAASPTEREYLVR
jgi:hypothetical protein